MKNANKLRLIRRKRRISTNIFGTANRPRIVVFRSNKYIYAQAVDDAKRVTVGACDSQKLMKKDSTKVKKAEVAKQVGVELAKILTAQKITKGVFDRSVYAYLGRVKSLAEGLREGGLTV